VTSTITRFVVHFRVTLLVAAAIVAGLAAVYGADTQNHLLHRGFDDPGADSTRAAQVLRQDFDSGVPDLILIVDGGRSVDDPAVVAAGTRLTERASRDPWVRSASSYWAAGRPAMLRSQDSRLGLVLVQLAGSQDSWASHAKELVPRLRATVPDLRVQAAGEAEFEAEIDNTSRHDLWKAEELALPITLILLVLVFGSLVAAGLPILVGVLAIISTTAILRLIAEATPVSIYALNITTALGLGLAIDYSLFIVTRFREELRNGLPVPDAVQRTMATAGRTVVFSAVTVVLSLSALLVFPLYFLKSVAYGGIAVTLVVAATAVLVLPAALALLGPAINRGDVFSRLGRSPSVGTSTGGWHRLATTVMRYPVPVAVAVIAALLLLGAPFRQVSFGLFDDRVMPRTSQIHQATQTLRDRFSTRDSQQMPVVLPTVAATDTAALRGYATRLSQVSGVARVDAATGSYIAGAPVAQPTATSARFSGTRGTWLSVTPAVEPVSDAGKRLTHDLRAVDPPGRALIGGSAATLADTQAAIGHRLVPALAIIASITFILLFLFTGSLLLPVQALVLNILSLTTTLGAMVWIFQEGHLLWLVGNPLVTGSLDITIPILMFCIAFGLSMDYEVFMLSRIVEEHHQGRDDTHAVAFGLERTGRLITAAAVIIAAVLMAFATSGVTMLKLLGVGLAIAVIVDATLIRGLLLPAFMRLAGRANWWCPPLLQRVHQRFIRAEHCPD
jgi:RND superfamily putative drug exporter